MNLSMSIKDDHLIFSKNIDIKSFHKNLNENFFSNSQDFKFSSTGIENYLNSRYYIELITTLPIITYGIYLTYIIHMAKDLDLSSRKINKKSLNFKKRLSVLMTGYFFYQLFLISYLGQYYLNSIDLFLYLFLQIFEILISLLTPFVIRELSKKLIQIPYRSLFSIFWLIICMKILIEIYFETFESIFFRVITFSSIGLMSSGSLAYMFFRFPKDDLYPSNNEVYYELQLLPMLTQSTYNPLITKDDSGRLGNLNFTTKSSKMTTNPNFKKFKPLTPVHKIKDIRQSIRTTRVGSFKNDISLELDEISNDQPEFLPHYPKIDIIFRGDYRYFQSNVDDNGNSGYKRCVDRVEFHQNFYFQIVVNIKDKNILHLVKRSIRDFLNLELDLKNEFAFEKYSKKLTERLPRLKLPRNTQSVDFFKNYKINFEIFLKNIVNEPSFITDDVLEFLEIQDDQLKLSYEIARKKNLNITRLIDDTNLYPFLTNKNEQSTYGRRSFIKDEEHNHQDQKDIEDILRESLNRIKNTNDDFLKINSRGNTSKRLHLVNQAGQSKNEYKISLKRQDSKTSNNFNYLNINQIQDANYYVKKNQNTNHMKFTVLEIKKEIMSSNYLVIIRISQSIMFKIVEKKLSEIINMVSELANMNKNNENIKNLLKMYHISGLLQKSEKIENFNNNINLLDPHFTSTQQDINSFNITKFYALLENVLQNSYDNLKIYSCNQVVSDFFFEFVDESRTNSRCESFYNIGPNIITVANAPSNQTEHSSNTFNHCDNMVNYKSNQIFKSNSQNIFKSQSSNQIINELSSNSFNPNKQPQAKKRGSDFFKILENYDKIKFVSVNITDSIYVTHNFKPYVFYVAQITLQHKGGTNEVLNKKFKYREINEYINKMASRLRITGKLYKKSTGSSISNVNINHDSSLFTGIRNTDEKIKYRKFEIQKNLEEIFKVLDVKENNEWTEIFDIDIKYQNLKILRNQENNPIPRPGLIFRQRTDSIDTLFNLNIRDSIL